ncbi:MAG: Rieske 2Fe-2S domain-containing protein [Alphaproteobacteria bacterium]|nr:Rieske 2Fe-2S domain-containing protein [Alphaproteobacteria bacterium]
MMPAHTMIHVRDLDGAIEFYVKAFGLEVVERHACDGARLVYLCAADSDYELELVCPAHWTFADSPEPGRTHIAFAVKNLEAEHRRLSALDLEPGTITAYHANGIFQTRYFYLNDPEGNQIEVLESRGRYGSRGEAMPNIMRDLPGTGFTNDAAQSYTPDAAFYFDQSLYQGELAAIFHRNWLYFCHQSQIPRPGDYVAADIAGQSIYVIRDKSGAVYGFFNVCQHRAHQLLTPGSGNIRNTIRCPYHSWTYDLDGSLRGAPKCEEVTGFRREDVRLRPIGVEIIGGFIFVNIDPGAEPLSLAVPHFAAKLLAMCPEAERLQLVKRQDFNIKANWKVVVENFLENYHSFYSGPAHRQLSDVIDQDSYRWSIDGKVIEFLGKGGTAESLPYAFHAERRFTGREDGFQIVFLWPNMAFIIIPGASMLLVFLMNPDGAEGTAEPLLYFGLDSDLDHGTVAAVDWFNNILGPEDVELVESVQRGLHSLGYTRGRLMVDPGKKEAWSEHFLHHFNSLNIAAVKQAKSG